MKIETATTLKRIATYERVSIQEQATENTSLALQEGQLIAYCQMRGWRSH